MPQALDRLRETPSQTAGPYVHIGLVPSLAGVAGVYPIDPGGVIAGPETPGERIRVEGRVFDGDGGLVRDALIETWQADANGVYNAPLDPRHGRCAPDFIGWGRCATDFDSGVFAFETVKPGPAPGPRDSMMAPHISFWIVARGINLGLSTRLYFPEEETANAADPVLRRIENPARRATLIAQSSETGGDNKLYRFDIRLQGEGETVFFAT
ncbi:protocatechuate 3,4-dioxygenase subunit alpha [Algihabitans albus]|uniref:protocatechuate 3,4-dioxygenase subunit alpha n=1 Tax=Algihabitans albus TaxID=2164067 RepID=UPI000E5DA078|nr:protocatechuate 3,4-dioxygenase subunit alpha [Algihabitans albus]